MGWVDRAGGLWGGGTGRWVWNKVLQDFDTTKNALEMDREYPTDWTTR